MKRVLLLGEAPGKAEHLKNYDPLVGRASRFLAMIAGIEHDELLKLTVRANLFDCVMTHWNKEAASHNYNLIVSVMRETRAVILLGRKVQAARDPFWLVQCGYAGLISRGNGVMHTYHVPHPSGRCRWWNVAANRELARRTLRTALLGETSAKLPT